MARGSHCSEVFTSSTREGEVSLWDLSTQSRSDVFWPTTMRPFTYVVCLKTEILFLLIYFFGL